MTKAKELHAVANPKGNILAVFDDEDDAVQYAGGKYQTKTVSFNPPPRKYDWVTDTNIDLEKEDTQTSSPREVSARLDTNIELIFTYTGKRYLKFESAGGKIEAMAAAKRYTQRFKDSPLNHIKAKEGVLYFNKDTFEIVPQNQTMRYR